MDLPNTKPNHVMFSLQQNNDFMDHEHLCLISFQQEDQTPDLHQHVPVVDNKGKTSINYASTSTRKRGGNRSSNHPSKGGGGSGSGGGGGGDGGDNDQMQKKMVHREIERQRRQEMTNLYASLRELLPLEFIKGNRSISDHMNQAVHYIKQMEETIKGLREKRDEHKNTSQNSDNTVSVSFCNGGVEILINSCLLEDGFLLSEVLNTIVEEGFSITSCTLTKVNDRLFHSILTEASDLALIDPSMLQQRLALVANTKPNYS
ncbi:hypothetical protein R6Q59_019854 [Mikania micrantha]|uniref:BHLH domain-containing protein n=1 Tax=Mikania micrantha TaxID=192012 RepID=A0A5N6PR11_9ASTR|nr:hypothetical protein E3N88_07250 [Mikania micrantha]